MKKNGFNTPSGKVELYSSPFWKQHGCEPHACILRAVSKPFANPGIVTGIPPDHDQRPTPLLSPFGKPAKPSVG